jgi:hypothetical protein
MCVTYEPISQETPVMMEFSSPNQFTTCDVKCFMVKTLPVALLGQVVNFSM